MRCLVVPALCFAAGCGRIGFDAPTGTLDGGGSGTTDGRTNDGASGDPDGGAITGCVAAMPATTFPGGLPCSNWGGNSSFNNASMGESSGTLTITPNSNNAGAEGRCDRMTVTIGSGGAFAEVSQVLAGNSSQTRLEILWGGDTYFIGTQNGSIRAGTTSGVTFTGGMITRWWRIRPSGDLLLFETSADGVMWDDFASMGGVPSGTATLRVVARTPSAEAAPGTARFESVNTCP